MNNYIDSYSRYHNKPITDSDPYPCNNAWIFTSYAKKLGLIVDMNKLGQCFNLCRIDSETLVRNPDDSIEKNVPISRDEIIGMVALGVLKPRLVRWNFSPFPLPKFSAVQLAKQLYELRPSLIKTYRDTIPPIPKYSLEFKHRNYFWQNKLDQIYRFAFSVPLQDRHFMLKCWDKFQWYNPVHVFYATVSKVDSMLPKKSAIKWLKYGGEENKAKLLEEFPEDHQIIQRIR